MTGSLLSSVKPACDSRPRPTVARPTNPACQPTPALSSAERPGWISSTLHNSTSSTWATRCVAWSANTRNFGSVSATWPSSEIAACCRARVAASSSARFWSSTMLSIALRECSARSRLSRNLASHAQAHGNFGAQFLVRAAERGRLLLVCDVRPAQSEVRSDARAQLLGLERHRDVVGSAQAQTGRPVRGICRCADEDDRDAPGVLVGLEPAAHLKAVHALEANGQQDQVRRIAIDSCECPLCAVGRKHVVARRGQDRGHQRQRLGHVVDRQESGCIRHTPASAVAVSLQHACRVRRMTVSSRPTAWRSQTAPRGRFPASTAATTVRRPAPRRHSSVCGRDGEPGAEDRQPSSALLSG